MRLNTTTCLAGLGARGCFLLSGVAIKPRRFGNGGARTGTICDRVRPGPFRTRAHGPLNASDYGPVLAACCALLVCCTSFRNCTGGHSGPGPVRAGELFRAVQKFPGQGGAAREPADLRTGPEAFSLRQLPRCRETCGSPIRLPYFQVGSSVRGIGGSAPVRPPGSLQIGPDFKIRSRGTHKSPGRLRSLQSGPTRLCVGKSAGCCVRFGLHPLTLSRCCDMTRIQRDGVGTHTHVDGRQQQMTVSVVSGSKTHNPVQRQPSELCPTTGSNLASSLFQTHSSSMPRFLLVSCCRTF